MISMGCTEFLSKIFQDIWGTYPNLTNPGFFFLIKGLGNLLLLVDFSVSSAKIKAG
jgi:hypothetical protein